MLQTQYAVYLGKPADEGFSGFIVGSTANSDQDDFFLIIEIKAGLDKDKGREIVLQIKQKLSSVSFESLSSFENFINQLITEFNLPMGAAIACGYLIKNVFYLKTVGEGKIFIKRDKKFQKIIEGNETASGYLQPEDFFIFTSARLTEIFNQEADLDQAIIDKNPHQVVEKLALQAKTGNDEGAIGLCVQFIEKTESDEKETEELVTDSSPTDIKSSNLLTNIKDKLAQLRDNTDKKTTVTIIVIILIGAILIWSVGLGVKRRQEANINRKIKTSSELIRQKLDQAEEVAFLNLARSQILIAEAKDEHDHLEKLVGDQRKEVKQLKLMIQETEKRVVKKEEKKGEEFYDLTIINQQAKGDKLYLTGSNLAILDKDRGIIYQLSLEKKSVEKTSTISEIKKAELFASEDGNKYIFNQSQGITRIDRENKLKKVINADSDWEEIVDLWTYNGNLYLLDREKNKIYKYLVTDDGFSDKKDYFDKNERVNLTGAHSMAIDGSIYIGFGDYGLKYTAGTRDAFKTEFPQKDVKMIKLFTAKDLEKVYGWDKAHGAVYVLGKDGGYERQINASILTQATDLIVFEDGIYILVKNKIYKINLN